MRQSEQAAGANAQLIATNDALMATDEAAPSGALRARKPGAAGKVLLAAIVHHEELEFSSQEAEEEEAAEQDVAAVVGEESGVLEEDTTASLTRSAHDERGRPSLASKLGRLFGSKRSKRQLIDGTRLNAGQHDRSSRSCLAASAASAASLRGLSHQQEEEDVVVVGRHSQRRRSQTVSAGSNSGAGNNNNNNNSEQVIEFKFDLIVDEAAERGEEENANANEDESGGQTKDKLADNVNDLVESFVLDSSDVCLMSTGRRRALLQLQRQRQRLRLRRQSGADLNGSYRSLARRQLQQEFDYLSELAAHTLARSFGLLNSPEQSAARSDKGARRPSRSEADDSDEQDCAGAGENDDDGDDDESPAIGHKLAATSQGGEQRHSIELSATLFLSEQSLAAAATEGSCEPSAPPTRKFSIVDLLDEPPTVAGGRDLATNCDCALDVGGGQQQEGAAKSSPAATSIDCPSLEEALAALAKVRSRLAQLDARGRCGRCNANSATRARLLALEQNSLLLISLKLKRRINGGLFSNRMCLIEFDPKFSELHSIFESIFNGQALAYLKRHKIHLRALESKLLAAAATVGGGGDQRSGSSPVVATATATATATAAGNTDAAQNANDSGFSRADESELKQHHQVASYTNKLIQAEWLLYKQLSSALIRTLVIVHVRKLSVPALPPSISGSVDLILDDANRARVGELMALANGRRNYVERQQRLLMGENLILLEFARSIQRASATRLKRRKRHLKSHLVSSNASVASNLSAATTTTPHSVSLRNNTAHGADLFGSPFRHRNLSAAGRRTNRTGDDDDCEDDDYEDDYERQHFDYHYDEAAQFGRQCYMETSLTRHRHRHHHHHHHHRQQQQQQYHRCRSQRPPGYPARACSAARQVASASSGRHLAAACCQQSRSASHTLRGRQRQQQQQGKLLLLQPSDCQTESSSLSTSSESQQATQRIRSGRSSRAAGDYSRRLVAPPPPPPPPDNSGLQRSSTLNSNFSDSDSITSANLNSCSSSSYNRTARLPSSQWRPRRDVELRWLAKQARLMQRAAEDDRQLELNLMSPSAFGLFSSASRDESPASSPAAHERRSSSVSRLIHHSRETAAAAAALTGGVIQIDCHRPAAAPFVSADCHLSQDEEASSSSFFRCSSSSLLLLGDQRNQCNQHSQQALARGALAHHLRANSETEHNNGEAIGGALEDNTDNVSDICSVVAEPPKQLKLEEFLNQLSSIIAPIGKQANGHQANRPTDGKALSSCQREAAAEGEKCGAGDSDALADEDEEDCKSHSSVLEHLSSLAMESNSKLNSRHQQALLLRRQCGLERKTCPIGRQLSLEISSDNELQAGVDCSSGGSPIGAAMRDQGFAGAKQEAPTTGHLQRMLNSAARRSAGSRAPPADPSNSVEDKLRALTISCQEQQVSPSSPSASSGAFTSSNDSSCSSSSSGVAESQGRRAIPTMGGSQALSTPNSLKSRQQSLYASVIRSHQNVRT